MTRMSPYRAVHGLVCLLLAGSAYSPAITQGQGIDYELSSELGSESCCQSCGATCNYGPCPCTTRQTLFQWSYGTSFGGGPDRDEALVTDRPDFTEAASTVGRGVAQIEFGYTYTYDSDNVTSERSHSLPEALLRYGIFAEWLELRVAWNYAEERTRTGPASVTGQGAEDLYLGFKIGLTPQEGILPEMSLIPQMTVPTGSGAFNNRQVLPGVNWVYAWEVNDCVSTGGSSQFNRAVDSATNEGYVEFAQSWTVAYSLTDTVGAYTEWFALFPSSADTERPEHFFNGGFTYLLSNDIQLDVRAGVGLNDAADDYFVGSGATVRF